MSKTKKQNSTINQEDQRPTAYCGLYCPNCYKMVVSESAENLMNSLNNTHICGSANDVSEEFKKNLQRLVNLKCPKPCKEGGGNPDCKIRKCCKNKNLIGCWECSIFESCDNLTAQFKECCKKLSS